jgi:hypothetical protein
MKCEICDLVFEGRPNRKYCSISCRRKAEMKERERKRDASLKAWRESWTAEEKAFWDGIPELEIDWTPEQQKAWEEMVDNLPTLDEIMAINRPEKAKNRR